jgi:hypothetical protein
VKDSVVAAAAAPHQLVDTSGRILTAASFAPNVQWQPGERVHLGAGMSVRVVERRDQAGTVTHVVERT